MKLELKHLTPYLPYKIGLYGSSDIAELSGIIGQYNLGEIFVKVKRNGKWISEASMFEHSLILHPLSDLTKEIEVNGEKFVPLVKLTELSSIVSPYDFNGLYIKTYDNDPDYIECYENTGSPDDHLCIAIHIPDILKCEYWMINKLFEYHFDVFGLIKEGLAIDINTL